MAPDPTRPDPGGPPRDKSGTVFVLGIVAGTLVGGAAGMAIGQTGAGIAGGAFAGMLAGWLAASALRRGKQDS